MIKKEKTTREIQSEKKRAEILAVAEKLFIQYGYENTTLKDISKASGFSIGSIYNFFDNKENILLAISSSIASFSMDMDEAKKHSHSPYDYILNYLLAYAAIWEEIGPNLTGNIYSIFMKAYADPDNNRVKRLSSLDSLTAFIRMAQDEGTFDDSLSAEDAASYLMTICRGLLYEWCLFDGAYSLTSKATGFLPRILSTFIKE